MAQHRMTSTMPATPTVDAYLAELAARLRGPRRTRARVLAEVGDGLAEAIQTNLAQGMPPDTANARAVETFGPPDTVAHAFVGELATASARRIIALFVLTGPLVGIWWLLLLHPSPWRTGPVAMVAAIPAVPLIALAIATAAGTVASTGRLVRWLPEATPSRALVAATTVAVLCLAADLIVLGVLTVHLARGHPVAAPLAAVAATASLLRVGVAIISIRRGNALRRAIGQPIDS